MESEALTLLTRTTMRDIAHLLRPVHLAQLRKILDDKGTSPNAIELLKNANLQHAWIGLQSWSNSAQRPDVIANWSRP